MEKSAISLFKDYLRILNVSIKKPDKEFLREIIYNHLKLIPFENISKLYYMKVLYALPGSVEGVSG